MEELKNFIKIPEQKKGPKYRWQDMVDQISKQSGLSFGHCVALWNKGGYPMLQHVLDEFKETDKNKAAYVNWLLKKN